WREPGLFVGLLLDELIPNSAIHNESGTRQNPPQHAGSIETIHHWHANIQYNQIRPHRLRDANCLLPIRGLATHFKISFTREDLGEDLSDKAIVENTAAVRLFLGRRVVSVATTSCSRRTPFMHAGEMSTRGL